LTGYHTVNIADLWAANTTTNIRVDDLVSDDVTLFGGIASLQTIIGTPTVTPSSIIGRLDDIEDTGSGLPKVQTDLLAITSALTTSGHTGGMMALVGKVYNNSNLIGTNTTDVNDIKQGKSFSLTSHPDIATALADSTLTAGQLYIDTGNNVIRVK
jgi:hypothetical protein